MELSVTLEGFAGAKLVGHTELYCDDLKAVNTEDAETVAPAEVPVGDTLLLKKHSFNMLRYKV